jgi:ABC-2 type transport system permease protein
MTATLSSDHSSNSGSQHSAPLRTSNFAQTWAMSKRAIMAMWRQPSLVVPSLIFPLFFIALGTSSFSRAINIPGFPTVDSYLDFALAGAVVQGVLFGSVTGAAAMATDIENGFFDRLLASPSTRSGILVGRLAGGMAYGAGQTAFFMIVLLPFGLSVKSGPIGALALIVSGTLLALAVGALMSTMALRTGSAEAVQGSFPLLFIALFFSSAFFPRETMSGMYATLADYNPISYLVEGMRDLIIDGLTWWALIRALLVPAALAIATIALALRSLSKRLSRS